MKKFKLKLSTTLLILLLLVAGLSLGGTVWNIYNLFAVKNITVGNIISYTLIAILALVVFALSIAVLLFGRYTVLDGKLTVYFGFIKSTSKISDVVAITHFKVSNKLVIYFSDSKYSVIIISPTEYENFILALREQNPSIYYLSKTDGEDEPE